MLTFLLSNAVPAVLLGVGLLALFHLALRRPVEFVSLVLVVWIVSVALRDAVSLQVIFSGFRISAMDALALVMGAVGLGRLGLRGVPGALGGFALLLTLLLAIHLGRGIAEFGLETAVNSGRMTIYFVLALLYAATVPGGWDARVWRLVICAGAALAALAVPFWLSGGLGSAGESILRDGEVVTSRPVVAAGALLIAQAALLALVLRWPSRGAATWLALGGVFAVVLLQHRTVWVVVLLVTVAGFFLWAGAVRVGESRRVLAVAGVCLLLLPVVGWAASRSGPLVQSTREVTTESSTFAWRTTGWRELLASNDSPAELLAGGPSGESLDRRIDGQVVDVSAHNGFVETYVRFGLPGAIALALLGVGLWLRRRQVAEGTGLPRQAVALLLLSQLVFSLAYSLDVVQGVIVGVFLAGLAAEPRLRSARTARDPAMAPMVRPSAA